MANIRTLPIELQKVAETELGEIPARIPSDLQALKTWIEQEPHLKARLDDQFLVQFLRGCKYSLEKAKEKIDLFFTLKTKFPDLFNATDVHDEKFRKMFNYGYGLPLPRPVNDNGARIFFMKFEGDIAKGIINLEELHATVNAMHEIILMDDPHACIKGLIYVADLKDISLNLALQLTPSFLQKAVQFHIKSLPFRIKGCYMINAPSFFQTIVNIVVPMLPEKQKKDYGLPLPRPLNDNGARIFFMKFEGDIANGLVDMEELYAAINAMHEVILMDDSYACINGIIYVIDLKDISLNMVLKLTPSFLQKTVQFYTTTLPFRIKGYYIINTPSFFQTVLNIFIPMLSEKLKKRVFVYGQNYTNEENIIAIEYLPTYLGGENGSTEEHLRDFEKKWVEYETYFKENANYGTNELLRPGKPIDFDSIYGLGGSFRKLDVD